MLNIGPIRDALKQNLLTVVSPTGTNLRVYDTIPDVIVPPCAVVGQLDFTFDVDNARGLDQANVDIFVIVQRFSERAGQDKLDTLLAGTGPKSIKTAIESDRTLGGLVNTLRVTSADSGTYSSGDQTFLSYRYNLIIWG
jgi:hypothetical protein